MKSRCVASEVILLAPRTCSIPPPPWDHLASRPRYRGKRSRPLVPRAGQPPPSARRGFSTVIGDGRSCGAGTPQMAARDQDPLFPDEGGPAILEVSVPAWIMAILHADPISAGLAP